MSNTSHAVFTDQQLLDLQGVSARQSTFGFTLTDQLGNILGTLNLSRENPPTVDHDITRSPMVQMSGFVLPPTEERAINPLVDRVVVTMELQNGDSIPVGPSPFMFTDVSKARTTYGDTLTGTLTDLTGLLVQGLSTAFAPLAGSDVYTALYNLIQTCPITSAVIDGFVLAFPTTQPPSWNTGTQLSQVIDDIAKLAGCGNVWLDQSGNLQIRLLPQIASSAPALTYKQGQNINRDSLVISNGQLNAANRFVVVDSTGSATAPIQGVYDLPANAPNSSAQRGFYIYSTTSVNGLTSVAQADVVAQAVSLVSPSYDTVSWSSPPDPRHRPYMVVMVDGILCMETAWSMPLSEGAPMTHKAEAIYQPLTA